MSVIAFAIMAFLTILFASFILACELKLKMPALTQTGDTSLSPESVNWLAPVAFGSALAICLF